MTTKVAALSVACPSCGAQVGDRCWSGTRRGRHLSRGHHADRRRAAVGEHVAHSSIAVSVFAVDAQERTNMGDLRDVTAHNP